MESLKRFGILVSLVCRVKQRKFLNPIAGWIKYIVAKTNCGGCYEPKI